MAVSATPAATTYLRAFVVGCKDSGRPMSFTIRWETDDERRASEQPGPEL